jgi:hypothetical protein
VSIPYIETRADVIRRRSRVIIAAISVVILLAALGGLAATIFLGLPVDFSRFDGAAAGVRPSGQ